MTPKRKRFVEEYLIDLNAAKAYRRAGFAGNDNVCAVEGHRLLSDPKVSVAIAEAKAKRAQEAGLDALWVLNRLGNEANADMADLYTESGSLKPVHEWPLIWRQGLVAGIEVVEERDDTGNIIGMVRKVKLSDRIKRVELIGKHVDVQAFKEKVEHTGNMTLNILPEDAGL